MRPGIAYRGKKRVKVSAKCLAKKHHDCTMLDCECSCHKEGA